MTDSVGAFEAAFARAVGAQRGHAFWKGRVALYALCRALGLGPGDEVIVPGYTCVMDVNPFLYVGATPRYVDIDPATYNVSPAAVEAALSPRTKLIVAQHSYGIPAAMDALAALAERHNVTLVEDCCLAFGTRYNGTLCGQFGRAAFWSFQWNKPFTAGLGGMATTRDESLAEAVAAVRAAECRPPSARAARGLALQRGLYRALVWPQTTAVLTRLYRRLSGLGLITGSSAPAEFEPRMPAGFFTGMSAGQARAGLRELRRVEANLDHRRALQRLYDRLLGEAGWPQLAVPAGSDPVLVTYPVRVDRKWELLGEAATRGIELGSWFESPLHPKETPLASYAYRRGQCPHAERACEEVVTLPTHRRISARSARGIVAFLTRRARPAEAVA